MDIVERLRELYRFAAKQKSRDWDEMDEVRILFKQVFDIGYDAANEIEQLREAYDDMLRRERSMAVQNLGNEGQWFDILDAKEKKIERLREALDTFSCDCETEDDCNAVAGSFCGWVANAALKG